MFRRDFELEVYFSKWEFTAKHSMCSSDVESHAVSELLAMAGAEERAAWEALRLGYTETWGRPKLRDAIAATYRGLAAGNVLCFAGAEEGIFTAMRALLGPDDHAIVTVPNYQSAETVPLSLCAASALPLLEHKNWTIDLDHLKKIIRPNTKVISINFPNNPTGKILERAAYDQLIAIARARGIYVFSDEVFRLLEHDPGRRLPQMAEVYERGLSLNVMSKAYGLPGLRVGWVASKDRALLQRMERIKHYLSICNSGPSEVLALIALKNSARILERNRGIVAANLELLEAFMAGHAETFEWYRPDGGCIAFPRYLGPGTTEAFAERLVTGTGVLILPPSVYVSDLAPVATDRFRIGFGRSDFPETLALTRDFLKTDLG